jgi:TonB family protein
MTMPTPGLAVFRLRDKERSYLPLALAASAGLHALVYLWGYAAPKPAHPPIELDLTMSGHLGRLGGGRAARAAPPPPAIPAAAPKDWVKAADNKPAPLPDLAKEAAAPPASEPAPAAVPGPGPAGNGTTGEYGDGEGDMAALTRLPQLLNLGDLRGILRRFYPEAERLRGAKGTVVIDLHVDEDGRVRSVDVVRSAAPDFDDAAKRVGLLLRFSPARLGARSVPVKLRQAIQFNLSSEQ